MTSADILAALRARYAPPEWYLMSEVASGTGHGNRRQRRDTFADSVAVSAYQSGKTGAEIHGHEIKVSRDDWLHELADPGKADAVRQHCDRWWLVIPAPVSSIVRAGELPPGWGLMAVEDGAARVVEQAPLLCEPGTKPPIPRHFVAALVRRAAEERIDKEAAKGALLKAPLRQVAHGDYWGHAPLVLQCGHVHRRTGQGIPKQARCMACADGLPPEIEVAREAVKMMTDDELRDIIDFAKSRIGLRGWDVRRPGITPSLPTTPSREELERALTDAIAADAPDETVASLAAALNATGPVPC